MDKQELQATTRKQMKLLTLAIRLEGGDPIRASALLHSTGSRASMLCSVDPMDLLEADRELIQDHLRKLASR